MQAHIVAKCNQTNKSNDLQFSNHLAMLPMFLFVLLHMKQKLFSIELISIGFMFVESRGPCLDNWAQGTATTIHISHSLF